MSQETTRRIGAFIEESTRFIKNWFIYIVLIFVLFGGSFYISGLTLSLWHYDRQTYGFKQNVFVVKDGWNTFFERASYKNELDKWRNATYLQYDQLPEPDRTSVLEDLDRDYFTRWSQYEAQIGENFVFHLMMTSFIPFTAIAFIMFLMRAPLADFRPFERNETLHGDAKWATEKHIRDAGLRGKKGLLIGKDNRGFLIGPGYQHATLFAPTGSGKGVGFVVPNLLYWEESVFIHDIKLENYEITSGYRREVLKQDVFLWNPASPDGITHCYNPIDWVSKKPGQMVDDVQKIANLILPEQEFWNNEARSLFVGVTLYLLAVPEKIKSFGEVVRTLRSDDVVYNLAVVLDTIGKKIHPVSYMNIAAFLQKADKERSGVVSTLNSGLELWANPLIDTATASSDFNIQEIKRRKTTVYVGLTPDNIQRLQPLLQVFYQQATEFLSRKIPDEKDEPYGVLFMMDEFPTLGEMKQFHAGIAYFRGYNVRLFLIVQDTQQLKGIYEEHGMNTFLSNSTYRITFAANNFETANLISQLIGNKTVKQKSINKPKYLDLNPATRTIHESEIQRALLLPQEVIGLHRDEQIILIESTPPIKTKKIYYYKENFFNKRLLDPIDVPTQEPFDPRVIEEEKRKKKKEEEEKKKKEAAEKEEKENKEKADLPPPPPLPDFPDLGDDLETKPKEGSPAPEPKPETPSQSPPAADPITAETAPDQPAPEPVTTEAAPEAPAPISEPETKTEPAKPEAPPPHPADDFSLPPFDPITGEEDGSSSSANTTTEDTPPAKQDSDFPELPPIIEEEQQTTATPTPAPAENNDINSIEDTSISGAPPIDEPSTAPPPASAEPVEAPVETPPPSQQESMFPEESTNNVEPAPEPVTKSSEDDKPEDNPQDNPAPADSNSSPIPSLDDLPDFPELPDLPPMPSDIDNKPDADDKPDSDDPNFS